jgi:excisionase family DNA binding protein
MDEKFFTTEQVAGILQVHPFTILKYIKQGKLNGVKLGRVYRIKESDINIFIDDRTTKPKKENPKVKESKIELEPKNEFEEEKIPEEEEKDHYYII